MNRLKLTIGILLALAVVAVATGGFFGTRYEAWDAARNTTLVIEGDSGDIHGNGSITMNGAAVFGSLDLYGTRTPTMTPTASPTQTSTSVSTATPTTVPTATATPTQGGTANTSMTSILGGSQGGDYYSIDTAPSDTIYGGLQIPTSQNGMDVHMDTFVVKIYTADANDFVSSLNLYSQLNNANPSLWATSIYEDLTDYGSVVGGDTTITYSVNLSLESYNAIVFKLIFSQDVVNHTKIKKISYTYHLD